jgi:hypothetical protein
MMSSVDRITAFIYLLVRDEIPFGVVERLMGQVEATDQLGGDPVYSDSNQAEYAMSIAARLEDGKC